MQNDLSTQDVRYLATCLGHGPALRSLVLINCVRETNTHNLGSGLGRCTGLECLAVNYNNIECGTVAQYARSLGLCRALVILDLSGNAIFNDGAQEFACHLARYEALSKLTLPYNNIVFLGAAALLDGRIR